jgi:SGNH hydrolase-like domain, acetyltransferase AlgX
VRTPPSPPRTDAPRRRGRDALVLLAGVLVALALGEVLLRVVAPGTRGIHVHPTDVMRDRFINHDRIGRYDELLGWTLQPDAVGENRGREFRHEIRTNSDGFRDDEFPAGRDPAKRRIVLLGDSFGMGWGVRRNEMLASRLESALPHTEVINLSVAGYGTDQEVLLYERDGARYAPDLVMLLFVVGNDLENNSRVSRLYRKPYFLPDGDGIALHDVPVPYTVIRSEKVPVTRSPFPVHDWLDAHSALYAFAFQELAGIDLLRERWEESGRLHRQIAVFGRPQTDILRRTPPPGIEAAWWVTDRLLLRFRDDVRKAGAIPLVVIVPSHLQVYPEIWNDACRELHFNPADFDVLLPNRHLVAFCGREGIPVLDLLPDLREAAGTSLPLYFHTDPHWTAEGHRRATEALAAYLRLHGW